MYLEGELVTAVGPVIVQRPAVLGLKRVAELEK